tara:strand:- start:292 stop:429 length:138 start_codon:yes stop_codon:yes gene_type:complete
MLAVLVTALALIVQVVAVDLLRQALMVLAQVMAEQVLQTVSQELQ